MYDHSKQFRCTIIRGKSQSEMDDLLPAYAKVISEICPCQTTDFPEKFNDEFQRFLPESKRVKKTLDNHRTEISGKLFGMYYKANDGNVYASQRTLKYLEDNDQPAFFKDICYKMQFPNGMDKLDTLMQKVDRNICIRQNSYIIKLLTLAEKNKISISIKDIGYYVLNSLDVLQLNATPEEVIDQIIKDRKNNIIREIVAYDENGNRKASSYTMQHIKEQLNYLELANLIRQYDGYVMLNKKESATIEIFAKHYNDNPIFNVYLYDLSTVDKRKEFQAEWDYYFSTLSNEAENFSTDISSLISEEVPAKEKTKEDSNEGGKNLVQFGDAGESIVYEYEKHRVAKYNKRLTNKVIAFGKTKGVGFDIQSIVAKKGPTAEFCKYIEVKSTKRFTSPDPQNSLWIDTLNITRNEWVAAQQHKEYYSIYRVYFTKDGIKMFILDNIYKKEQENKITVIPVNYRCEFSNDSIDDVVTLDDEDGELSPIIEKVAESIDIYGRK